MNGDSLLIDMKRMNIEQADLNLLKVFEALHEEGSASRASVRLGLTQSAVSAALGRLRLLYGDALFQRTGRGLAPTLLADQLKPVISEALDRVRQSLDLVAPEGGDFSGRSVTVGLSDDFEIALAPRLLAQVARRAPQLRLIFRQTHSQIVNAALMERQVDLAITSGGITSQGLSRALLGEGGYACVVDPEGFGDAVALDLERFVASPHLLISSGGFIGIVDEALAALGRSRRVLASTTHFAALPYLLKGTPALATVPAHAAEAVARVSGLRVLACPLALRRYPIELGWRPRALEDRAVALVREAIEACFPLTPSQGA